MNDYSMLSHNARVRSSACLSDQRQICHCSTLSTQVQVRPSGHIHSKPDGLSTLPHFSCRSTLMCQFWCPYRIYTKLAALIVSHHGSSFSALTNDLSYINNLTWLSSEQRETPYTAHVEYLIPASQKKGSLFVVAWPLSLERGRSVKQNCNHDEKGMLRPSAQNFLLRIIDIIFLLLDRFSSDIFLVELLLQSGRHSCFIGFDCLFLNRDLLRPCIALYLKFRQAQYSKHDFRVLEKRLNSKFSLSRGIQLRTLAAFIYSCVYQRKSKSRFDSKILFKLISRIRLVNDRIRLLGVSNIRSSTRTRLKLGGGSDNSGSSRLCRSSVIDDYLPSDPNEIIPSSTFKLLNLGGGSDNSGSRLYDFSVIGNYLASDPGEVNPESKFRYVAHVDEIGLLAYSSAQFVRVNIPLSELFKFLPLTHARKIASVHSIPAGSRCSKAELLMHVENHSCLRCSSHLSVFSVQMSKIPAKLTVSEFPPESADTDLTRAILSKACKRMCPSAIEEAGCAVCGELKPLQKMSRLKSVKNFLKILEAPGVTRIERRTDMPIKEYTGPVLDYGCSQICDTCRKDVRNGKVPRLALANNLWLGKVPDELKNLRFVEKILIARVRHTCAYVKVASGMRKMKANIVAFESPVPKIYHVLPPPREDLDEVLAILFTGPSKPTFEDFSRTPFLVRRNAVITALEWLKMNHADYAKIEISREHMDQYDEDMPPVSIEYRESVTNKVPEGTSMLDQEEEEGTEEGGCAFAVHGLTGETLNLMSPNAVKVLALRHLNNNGRMLAVGHSEKLESMWNNLQLYPQMFPWLFPYGLGGVGSSNISHKEHKRHLLMYHDKRFQIDINFPFVAFSHEQMKANTSQSFLLVDQTRFVDISQRLMNIDWSALDDLTKRLETGEYVAPKTDAEKRCFQVIKDLDAVSGKMHGSIVSKKFMRSEIWSLINLLGAPYWYITLSPADIQHPICVYYAGSKLDFKPSIVTPYDDRMRSVCRNPVAGARFFHFMVETFITDVLGIEGGHRGFYGNTSGYYGTVEQQGRLTLHLHMLLWIKGSLNPQDMREKILKSDSTWQKRLIDWLESCHTGDFLTGTYTDVNETIIEERNKDGYVDPTQSLPVPPPIKCKRTHNETESEECEECRANAEWTVDYNMTVDDLLLRSNVHSCNRGTNKDGTRRKNKASGGCMNNKWGKCKARFPRPTFPKTIIDEIGSISLRKIEAWLNTITPLVTYIFRCNTDVTSLSSGTAIKGVVLYVSDYITKSTLKTHTIFDSIKSVFKKNSEMIGGSLPMKEKARRFMTKIANQLSAKAEMGAPMICMYLLGNPDHYTSHIFVPFYWQMYVAEVRRQFDTTGVLQPPKVALIKKKGKLIGISPVHDYVHHPSELEHVNLLEWIRCYKREKLSRSKRKAPSTDDNEILTVEDCEEAIDAENELSFQTASLVDDDETLDKPSSRSKNVYCFQKEHPLYESHAARLVRNSSRRVLNFAGANLPRRDQGDREYYCCSMLTLFKPWRSGSDLKGSSTSSWEDSFQGHSFQDDEKDMMKNFNIRYECLDARDDFRAQLKKGASTDLFGSWETMNGEDDADGRSDENGVGVEFDDAPLDPLNLGQRQKRRLKEMEMVNDMLTATGWTDPILGNADRRRPTFRPDKNFSGSEWEQEVEKEKQRMLEKKNEHNARNIATQNEQAPSQEGMVRTANVVKVVDKSYFEKKFRVEGVSNAIDDVVERFSLNQEQERAFRIISNHAISTNLEQLRMYLGGMGGTGKSQVIKALSSFFESRHEAHRFVTVAPTGTAAALLGGSTYHSMFGINDRMTSNKIGHIKAKLNGVDYVFFDEVSMLSARDLYRINAQLAKVFCISDVPFGGLNMVFCGDFAQLPPAVGGEHVSLYSRSIGTFATDKKSQEEAIRKALWHQITRVVILRQNMRQKKQSPEDANLRTALENMRYKSCTAADISFLRTRISSAQLEPDGAERSSICEENFRDVSIITGLNLQKDEINRLGALRFAQETNQMLTDFFSEDSTKVHSTDTADARMTNTKRVAEITDEMQKALWDQQPSSTDKHIAGKLSLCLGLPVMIRHNYATEICMTRGQEGYVVGWQSKIGTKGQRTLDTLFIELKNPPAEVHIDGLPKNVVPLYPTTNSILAYLPNDERFHISRTQVEVLVNFAMTDFGSQGKTRPYNVTYLNNLSSHQGYYTALSRSATASGTLILQGFDARKITGGCSGALRQEFREFELLDEITSITYASKLPETVCGDTRNNLIQTFREWKGLQYVPKLVHPAIRWSKRDPLLESQVYELNKTTADTATVMKKKRTISELEPKGQLELENDEEDMRMRKKRRLVTTPSESVAPSPCTSSSTRIVPVGLRWSQNSCAYDSVFTILFAIWCNDKVMWSRSFNDTGNGFSILLADLFSKYDKKQISLEMARDKVRKELARFFPNLRFGSYTSIECILDAMFTTGQVIYETFHRCPNGHKDLYSEEFKLYMTKPCAPFMSTSEWMRINSYNATNRCRTCGQAVDTETSFVTVPPLVILEFSNSSIEIDYS